MAPSCTMTTSSVDSKGNGEATLYADLLTELPAAPEFYEKYVKKRRPVLLKGCCEQVTPKLLGVMAVASLDKLLDIVGTDTMIQVNQRNNDTITSSAFSPAHSRVVDTPFGDFISHLKAGSCDYYMTTQTLPTNEEGQPLLYTSPVTQLISSNNMDSLKPPLLGNLVLMTCNLWMGQASSNHQATSSGLHHDYHDNLYCLLEGSKEFRIAPPSTVKQLKMRGTLHTLHANGRIVYHEQMQDGDMIRPDGALESVETIMKLEIRKEAIEQEIANTKDAKRRQELEEELNTVEEELLDLEMDKNGSENEDEGVFGSGYDGKKDSDSDGDEPDPKRSRLSSDDNDNSDDGVPLNFVVEENDYVQFQTVQMTKGDLLYLPAGWFHKVFSKGGSDGKNGLHIAFNYWMHPPDVGDDTSFQEPYRSKFWQRDWESRPESEHYT